MVSRVAAGPVASPMERELDRPDSIHESVRRLLPWRYLVVAGVSVAAWVAIGSTSAFADDHQSNSNTSTTVVDNNGAQSTGLITGPIVVPVTLGVQTNATGPVNLNLLGNQAGSGNGAASVSQANTNGSTTAVDNRNAQSAGLVSGPIVAPVTVGVQTNANGPVNVNAVSNQANSGNGAGGDVSQSNVNRASTAVDNRNAQSAGLIAGPIVAPVTVGVQTNADGPFNVNALSNQSNSGNGAGGDVSQSNANSSMTFVDNHGAQSSGLIAGPIVAPVTVGAQTNVNGPVNANLLSNQRDSGNGASGDVSQKNVNGSATGLDNRGAQSSGLVSGPIVVPVTGQVGTNADGPVNANLLSNQRDSGNGAGGDVSQSNANSSLTLIDNRGAQSSGLIAGPIVAPVTVGAQTNVNGPVNANLLSNQADSGNGTGGNVSQSNVNRSTTALDNRGGAQSSGLVSGPIVVPVTGQIGTNVNGPVNANLLSDQRDSGNGGSGDLSQENSNSSLTRVASAGGSVVVPLTDDLDTNLSGPANGNVGGNQIDSGSAGPATMHMVGALAIRDGSGHNGLLGVLVAALASLTALGSLLATRRRTER